MKLVTKTAVSVTDSFPFSRTKCSAQPMGMKTNKTFLLVSISIFHQHLTVDRLTAS